MGAGLKLGVVVVVGVGVVGVYPEAELKIREKKSYHIGKLKRNCYQDLF
jgi:hypothetical protein